MNAFGMNAIALLAWLFLLFTITWDNDAMTFVNPRKTISTLFREYPQLIYPFFRVLTTFTTTRETMVGSIKCAFCGIHPTFADASTVGSPRWSDDSRRPFPQWGVQPSFPPLAAMPTSILWSELWPTTCKRPSLSKESRNVPPKYWIVVRCHKCST